MKNTFLPPCSTQQILFSMIEKLKKYLDRQNLGGAILTIWHFKAWFPLGDKGDNCDTIKMR